MPRFYCLSVISFISFFLFTGQSIPSSSSSLQRFWQEMPESNLPTAAERWIVPQRERTMALEVSEWESLLKNAPLKGASDTPYEITLPLADGSMQSFRIVESPIMEPGLATRYPEIRTFSGQGMEDRSASVRLDVTPAGFHGMIISSKGTTYIDPYAKGLRNLYTIYDKRDFFTHKTRNETLPQDLTLEAIPSVSTGGAAMAPNGDNLRIYRTAIACTGEYAQFHGGTKASVLAAIVTTLNRVNQIYEREFAVNMVLIANNDSVIFLNSATDPYDNNDAGNMLGQNQSTMTSLIGGLNYDMGHVFSTGAGGIASLASVCRNNNKARGVTGISQPVGDPFDVDYVAHEIGHQFGGNHTFNSDRGSCNGNRESSAAYEPGSATTIMGYAGLCGADNIQFASDDYFHSVSYEEVVNNITSGRASQCGTVTPSGNTPPGVGVISPSVTIPIGTPFELEGIAADIDGDFLTYCWEQYDLGPSGQPGSPSGNAPLFRSFAPSPFPIRIFPQINDIVNNSQTLGELLPSYSRLLNFRLTVRDNHFGSGGVDFVPYGIGVTAVAGPFFVAYPNDPGIVLDANSLSNVFWVKENTDLPPVNCTEVNIFMSVDGGFTYPYTLAENVPNTGSAVVEVPDTLSSRCRIKIKGANNVFFDISNNNFTIVELNVSTDPLADATTVNVLGNPVDDFLNMEIVLPVSQSMHIEVLDLQGRAVVAGTFLKAHAHEKADVSVDVSALAPGIYFYRLKGDKITKSGKVVVR
ncbi:M12 family metallo-peptidase [bacterium]|nr:M12 family metallo-peptidase [bacterium]